MLGVRVGNLGGDGAADTIDSAKAYWNSMPVDGFASGYMNGNLSAYVMIWKHEGFGRIELRYRGTGTLEIYNKGTLDGNWTKLQ